MSIYDLLFWLILTFILLFSYKKGFFTFKPSPFYIPSKNETIHNNEFIIVDKNLNNSPNKISLATYNILCQKFMKRKGRKDLNLDNRMEIVIQELKSLDADIICLQETNFHTYKNYFLNNFPNYKFEYGDNYGSYFINVIAYKANKFNKINRMNLNLRDIDVQGNRGIFNVQLEDKISKQTFSVYNVHFPWRPIYEIEKGYFLNLIAEDILVAKDKINHFIIAGDFNSIPNSLVMRLLNLKEFFTELKILATSVENNEHFKEFIQEFKLSQYIKDDKFDKFNQFDFDKKYLSLISNIIKEILNNESHKNKFGDVLNNFLNLHEKVNIKSCYGEYKKHLKLHDNSENNNNWLNLKFINLHPDYTNYTENFKNTIDYILHSEKLSLVKILKLPNKTELSRESYLPCSKYPSDHIKLYSEFIYKN